MKLVIMFFLLCFLVCRAAPPPPPQPSFHEYTLVIQWPKSYCKMLDRQCPAENTKSLPLSFSLHGLWPDGLPKPTREEREKDKLKFRRFPKDLQNRIKLNFINVKRTYPPGASLSDEYINELWGHEWGYHGIPSGLSQEVYFRTALDLLNQARRTYNQLNSENKNKYDPGTVFDLDEFAAAFDKHGRRPGNLQFISAASDKDSGCGVVGKDKKARMVSLPKS